MLMGMMIIVGFIVGFLVGCTGMGGIILIPALVYLSGLSSHVAMGTTLFTFIFTTSLCSWLYIRLGHVDWKATIPICIGGFLFTYVGADVKAFTRRAVPESHSGPADPAGGRAGVLPGEGAAFFLYGRGAAVALLGAVRRWQRRGASSPG